MAKVAKPDADQRLKAFFRETMLNEPGITSDVAEQLASRCVQSIDTVLTQRGIGLTAGVAPASSPAAGPQFDPFAFSAVSVLARKGSDALLARLGEINSADHLREFASAQHIAIDQSLTNADDLRVAILRGTERRIAARRAAAS